MILQVGVVHHLMNEACGVLHACGIGSRVGTVEGEVEMEVGVFLLQSEEVVELEHFVKGACAIEVVHLTIGSVQSLGHVHDLSAQRSHTGTTTYPNHLAIRVEMRMEVAVRSTHHYLVAWLQGEDV